MFDIETLKFDKWGLIPAVVVDAENGRVLTLAYMNRESLGISIIEGRTCFWSRSRGALWRKGEQSGNVQHIVKIVADCDRDALTIYVKKEGPACHTGADSCFNDVIYESSEISEGDMSDGFSVDSLYEMIKGRKSKPKEGSYTTYLFEKGLDKILKKVGEESTEVIIAGKGGDRRETVYEIADLAYHLLVMMAETGISPDDIRAELASRHVVDKKVKQEKMV